MDLTLNDVITVIGIMGTLWGIIATFLAIKSGLRKDGTTQGTLLSDIGYIKSSTDEIKAEQKEQRKTNTEVVTRLTAVEVSAKQAHKRLDRIEHTERENEKYEKE